MAIYDFHWFAVHIALNGLLLWLLAVNVSRLRMKLRIAYGDGGNNDMNQAIRTHANGVENVMIYSFILLALTFVGVANWVMATMVLAFLAGRVLHAIGMLQRNFTARRVGAGITFLAEIVAIVVLLVGVFSK